MMLKYFRIGTTKRKTKTPIVKTRKITNNIVLTRDSKWNNASPNEKLKKIKIPIITVD